MKLKKKSTKKKHESTDLTRDLDHNTMITPYKLNKNKI
jgi:hypothetical protein